jgi:hydrogenase/urease accessory protein HupE
MIVRENEIKVIDKKIEKMSKGLKKGFWAGLLAFVLAKITHLLVTLAIGIWLVVAFGYTETVRDVAAFIDNPIVGIIYLIFVTRFIYFKITK